MFPRHRHTVWPARVAGAAQVALRRRAAKRYAEPGVPDSQLPRPQAVVGEQEIPYRMRLTGPRSTAMRLTEVVHPLVVQPFASGPVGLIERRLRHGASRRAR